MAVFNAQVFPPSVTVELLRSVFKLHSMCLDLISSTPVFMSIFRSCSQCSSSVCQDQAGSLDSGHGVSAGVVAGAVIGSILLLALSVGLFLRRRRRNATALQTSVKEVKDIPAPADTVLNRPDPSDKIAVTPLSATPAPNESVVRVYANSNATINLVPSSPAPSDSSHSNPFGDNHSIQTTSTGSQSTNVIPIAFVPPPASVLPSVSLPQASSTSLVHVLRPPLQLNMDHMNLSIESVPLKSACPSGASTIPDDGSYISNASYASDVLSVVPTIVTGRQVANSAKAAVVPASSAKSLTRHPSIRSPLTGSSFGPQDIVHEADESHPLPLPPNPFADQRPPPVFSSVATQGFTQPPQDSGATGDQNPSNTGSGANESDRPSSTYTQAASLIGADIMDATRVHLGFAQPASASVTSVYHGTPLPSSVMGGSTTLVRMASGRLVSPFTPNPLARQQESSLATLQAGAQQSEKVQAVPQRMSMSTMASGVSGRADSILESFTFVPPSPISNRPLRTPPRSPLVQETHHVQDPPLEPPNRQVLGMSTGSQLSSMSTGLGSFPFQIDHGSEGNQTEDPVGVPPSRQFIDKDEVRASLDTLALTRDLTSSYPSG